MTPKQLHACKMRAAHINSLASNVGLVLTPVQQLGTYDVVSWRIDLYDDGDYCGWYAHYKHERSAVRAIWRLYRQRTGD